jgi:hypothetical protein
MEKTHFSSWERTGILAGNEMRGNIQNGKLYKFSH